MIRTLLFMIVITLTSVIQAESPSVQQRRIYVDVCADLMHAGHVEFFKKARALGDYLIVGIHSDEVIASYKRVPIMTLEERVTVVQACRYVDEVISAAPLIVTKEWIENYQIDLVVHGDDFDLNSILYCYGVPLNMGIFKTVPYTQGISTTDIINRIKTHYCQE